MDLGWLRRLPRPILDMALFDVSFPFSAATSLCFLRVSNNGSLHLWGMFANRDAELFTMPSVLCALSFSAGDGPHAALLSAAATSYWGLHE
jgi:hypothetical protein